MNQGDLFSLTPRALPILSPDDDEEILSPDDPEEWDDWTPREGYVINAIYQAACGHTISLKGTVTTVKHIEFIQQSECYKCWRRENGRED